MGLPQVGGRIAGSAPAHDPGVHRPTLTDRPSGDRGPAHFGGVQEGREVAREPDPDVLVGARV